MKSLAPRTYQSIKFNEKAYIDDDFVEPITEESLAKECEEGTINKINPANPAKS